MKSIFKIFRTSLYGPDFYSSVADAPLKDALRYYVRLGLILSLVTTITLALLLAPRGVRFVKNKALVLVKDYYPAELAIQVKDGEASTNVTEPYIIAAKGMIRTALTEKNLENIFVIDTKNEFTPSTFESYKTFALLTKHEIVTQGDYGQSTRQRLPHAGEYFINQQVLLAWTHNLQASMVYIVPLGIIMTFGIVFVSYLGYLLLLFLFAGMVFFLAKIRHMPLSYAGAYKMSLYAVVPGLVLKSLLNASGIFFVPAYLTFLVFLLIVFLNVRIVEQPTLFKN